MFERLIKRTIWEAKCESCEWNDVKTDHAPREKICPGCGTWIPYVEKSAIGPDLGKL